MAGRGAIPVVLSPDYVEAIRYRYVETDQPVREICAEFEISVGKIDRLIRKHGWPKRTERPPREMPAAARLREEARLLAVAVATDAALPPPERGRSDREAIRVGVCCEMQQTPTPTLPLAGGGSPGSADAATFSVEPDADPIARIEALVLRELAAEEAVRARLGSAPRERADAEKIARTLAIHTQTLQNLERLRATQMSAAYATGRDHDDDDDMPADLDAFRLALAQRIEAFVASQPDDEGLEEDAAEGPAAAGP